MTKPDSWLESLVASWKPSLSPTLGCHWAPLSQEWSILDSSWTRWREDSPPLQISSLTLEDWNWLILSFLLFLHMLCVLYSYLSQSSITLREQEGTAYGRGSDSNAKMKSLVAWPKCCKPKKKGGLGIINLRSQNSALLLKHLDKFYNKKEIP